jgi:hypothetical protein
MSRMYGDIRQIAFVVRDIDHAMQYWTQVLGIGPFFVKRRITFSEFVYRESSTASPTVTIALANSGYIQIELIQQHDDTPSIYKEFIDRGREGLQHVSSWMTRDHMIKRKQDLVSQGVSVAQECTIASSGVHLVYFDTNTSDGNAGDWNAGNGGFIFEISDLMEPAHLERIQNIQNSAADWSGDDPVREVGA